MKWRVHEGRSQGYLGQNKALNKCGHEAFNVLSVAENISLKFSAEIVYEHRQGIVAPSPPHPLLPIPPKHKNSACGASQLRLFPTALSISETKGTQQKENQEIVLMSQTHSKQVKLMLSLLCFPHFPGKLTISGLRRRGGKLQLEICGKQKCEPLQNSHYYTTAQNCWKRAGPKCERRMLRDTGV